MNKLIVDCTTDELVHEIVTNVGIPLPKFDYESNSYVTQIPVNVPNGDNVTGKEDTQSHPTFREACIRVILWNENERE